MIVRTINIVKESIGVNAAFEYSDIKPYIKRAERNFLKKLIGIPQYDLFNATAQPSSGKVFEALELAQDAVSNLAYYLGLPTLSVQVSSSGFFVPENENTKPISDKQFKELQRSFKSAGHEALDELLDFMETNKDDFSEWISDASYTEFKDLLVYNTTTFQNEFNINYSRQTFLALAPNIKIVEDQFIKGPVQDALFTSLKADQAEQLRKDVKALLIKSIVAFTIHKTMDNGLFIVDANGMHMRFDVLPYEKTVTNINLKINDFIINTKKNKLNEGEEYLKKAMAIIADTANAAVFSEYTLPVSKVDKVGLKTTKSIVGML